MSAFSLFASFGIKTSVVIVPIVFKYVGYVSQREKVLEKFGGKLALNRLGWRLSPSPWTFVPQAQTTWCPHQLQSTDNLKTFPCIFTVVLIFSGDFAVRPRCFCECMVIQFLNTKFVQLSIYKIYLGLFLPVTQQKMPTHRQSAGLKTQNTISCWN